MNKVFSKAAIERIARVVQLPGEAPENAAGFLRQVVEDDLHDRLSALEADARIGVWHGDDLDPALQFVSFAGFLELGVESGYLSLEEWEGAPALKQALAAFLSSPSAESGAADLRLLGALLRRLEQPDSAPRASDDAAFASFESYLHLTSRLRSDAAARAFLEETHTLGYPDGDVAGDLAALLGPRHFAEAFANGAIQEAPVTDTSAGLALLQYFEWFAEILEVLSPTSELREDIIRHARWAHGATRVEGRFDHWVARMRDWTERPDEAVREWFRTKIRIFRRLATEQERWNAFHGALSAAPPPSESEAKPPEYEDRSVMELIDQLAAEGRDVAARRLALSHALRYASGTLNPDAPDFFERTNELVARCRKLAELGSIDAAAAIVAPVIPGLTARFDWKVHPMVADALNIVARARRGPRAEEEERGSAPAARNAETAVERDTEENRYLAT